jgi:hypothetical protein
VNLVEVKEVSGKEKTTEKDLLFPIQKDSKKTKKFFKILFSFKNKFSKKFSNFFKKTS